jgi:UDP-glucose 4-epimerase
MLKPWDNLNVNSKGVINLLEAIRRNNSTCKMIHLSTTTQLGSLHYLPADELHPEFPTDLYSANKMVSEKYCLIYAKAFGIKTCVIRLCNIFGPRAAIHSPEFTFNNYFIGLALKNKSITVYKPGNQLRNILYVDDVVNAILLSADLDKTIGNTFFAVGDEHHSVKEIAEKTCEIMGGSIQMTDWPKDRKAIEIGDAVISNKKIKETLGWKPKVTLEEGLKLTYNFYKDKLGHYFI